MSDNIDDRHISIEIPQDIDMNILDRERCNYSPTSLSDDERSILEGHNSSEDEHIGKKIRMKLRI